MSDNQQFKMTSKLALALLGAVLTLLGILVTHRGGRWALLGGLTLASAGIAAFFWSASISNWCAPANQKFGTAVWGTPFMVEPPTLAQCWKMVYGR